MLRWLTLTLVVMAVLFARTAKADQATAHTLSVAVLSFDSDDAEDRADALTGAVRSRVRASQGWSLVETTQSLGMLTAALQCKGKPLPADCEQRIADHIRSERYIFGYVSKGPAGQVTAEIHLYQKNKADTVIKESYADNLKEQNDDHLRTIAQHLLEKLGGNAVGTIVVRMGTESGEVVVDGEKHIPMENGHAHLESSPGSHSVEVTPTGKPSQKRTVLVAAGKETVVDLVLQTTSQAAVTTAPEKKEKPFPTRKVLGGVAMALGVVGGVIALVELGKYNDLNDRAKASGDLANIDTQGKWVPACDAKDRSGTTNHEPCRLSQDAQTASTIGIVSAVAGGVLLVGGAYLLFFGGDSNEAKASATAKRKTRILPTVGVGSGGLLVNGTF